MNEREMVVVPRGFNCDFAMIMECEYMVNVGIQPGDMLYFRAPLPFSTAPAAAGCRRTHRGRNAASADYFWG